jgi:hypothetical protein
VLVIVSTHERPREQIKDAACAAHGKLVNGGMFDVVKDRQVDDPADLNAVRAANGPA